VTQLALAVAPLRQPLSPPYQRHCAATFGCGLGRGHPLCRHRPQYGLGRSGTALCDALDPALTRTPPDPVGNQVRPRACTTDAPPRTSARGLSVDKHCAAPGKRISLIIPLRGIMRSYFNRRGPGSATDRMTCCFAPDYRRRHHARRMKDEKKAARACLAKAAIAALSRIAQRGPDLLRLALA